MFGLCAAQDQPLMPYGNHNPSEVKSFALGGTSKQIQYKNYLLLKTGESGIRILFQKVRVVKDTLLQAGSYQNSCWNVQKGLIKFYEGREYAGDVTVYEDGSRKIILYKNDCANLLNCKTEYFTLNNADLPYEAPKKEIQIVYVDRVVGNTYQNPRPRVNVSWGISWNTPKPCYGGNTYNNTNVNYNQGSYNPPRNYNGGYYSGSSYTPPRNYGGPGGAPTHTGGGPGGAGMNYGNNGYGGNSGGAGMNTSSGGSGRSNNGYGPRR